MSGGRNWTLEEHRRLCEMISAGRQYRSIARALKRSEFSCRSRASIYGLKLDRKAVLANREKGRERFRGNAKKVARRKERMVRTFTPDERAVRAEELRQRNRAGITGMKGKHHRPDVCARISAANKGRKFTDEHRAKIAEGRRQYWKRWRANRPEALAKAAMQEDRRRQEAVGAWGEVQHNNTEALEWCGQCERRVSMQQANACASPFCKAKALAA